MKGVARDQLRIVSKLNERTRHASSSLGSAARQDSGDQRAARQGTVRSGKSGNVPLESAEQKTEEQKCNLKVENKVQLQNFGRSRAS